MGTSSKILAARTPRRGISSPVAAAAARRSKVSWVTRPTVGVASLLVAGVVNPAAAYTSGPVAQQDYIFISSPDFLNRDVGDIAGRDADWSGVTFHYVRIDGQMVKVNTPPDYIRNSTSPDVEAALGAVLDEWKSHRPSDVLVAGDLVEGVWHEDSYGTGVFGPLDTSEQKTAAVRRAGATYFGDWVQRFRDHDLTFHTALGDHDIGDNYWPTNSFKHSSVGFYKHVYGKYLTGGGTKGFTRPRGPAHDTAYAAWANRDPRVLVISLDVFEKQAKADAPSVRDGVVPRLDQQQLAWFRRTLSTSHARADWIIVQGHTPVLGPVNRFSSSGLLYGSTHSHRTGTGARSDLWRTMVKYGADLYLAGEVHDLTVRRAGGVTQISHGGPFPDRTDYLLGRITGRAMNLSIHDTAVDTRTGPLLWQLLAHRMFLKANVTMGQPQVVGTLRLTSRGRLLNSTGAMRPCKAHWTPALTAAWRWESNVTPCGHSHLDTHS